jgi:GDPmannose 4,6-dehydratase
MTKLYRESYDLFCVNGILFNHESPYRGQTFVTRKITRAVGRIVNNLQSKLTLGNLDASRDWGFAGDYVEGMWLMLQHDTPDDWVLATGETHTVREFLQKAFEYVDLDWEKYVQTSEKYFRPNEVEHLLGDSTKARKELNWSPKTSFDELVKLMIEHDLVLAEQEKVLIQNKLMTPTWENPII